jgi:hypothetical protein
MAKMSSIPTGAGKPRTSSGVGVSPVNGKPNNLTATVPYKAPKGAFRDMKH